MRDVRHRHLEQRSVAVDLGRLPKRALRVSAPTRRAPFSTAMPASSERPLMSISTAGADSRRFRDAIRLWPPASTRASSPYRARSSKT
jgi:hypothetical protein